MKNLSFGQFVLNSFDLKKCVFFFTKRITRSIMRDRSPWILYFTVISLESIGARGIVNGSFVESLKVLN